MRASARYADATGSRYDEEQQAATARVAEMQHADSEGTVAGAQHTLPAAGSAVAVEPHAADAAGCASSVPNSGMAPKL